MEIRKENLSIKAFLKSREALFFWLFLNIAHDK